jgi:hypothetical protein
MAITLINCSGVSFRSVSKVFIVLNISFNLNLRVPTHATVLNWVKKQGIANFRDKAFYDDQKWILIVDESIQFGNKKLLAVLAVPASKQALGRALTYKDLVPVILKASESWKANEIESEIRSCMDVEQVLYIVSDNGNNLKSSYSLLGIKHIEDVGHKFSWIIKETLEKQDDFEAYTKLLSGLRGKLSMSKYAHIVPPNQRIMSRFMNLSPLFKWGNRILKLLDKKQLNESETEKVGFVNQYRELINQTNHLLCIINKVQKILKNEGFSKDTTNQCLRLLENINDERGKKVVAMIETYFEETLQKMSDQETILCSSDIIESCFGKYKSIVKANKSVGITDLCLCISCLMSDGSIEQTKKAMGQIKTKQIKDWNDKNIGETLYAKRNALFKKAG